MWIMLNGSPLETSKIEKVSKVFSLDTNYFRDLLLQDEEGALRQDAVPEEVKEAYSIDMEKAEKSGDEDFFRIYGYSFSITVSDYEIYWFHNRPVSNPYPSYIYSKCYEDEQSANDSLTKFLEFVNKQEISLPKIEI